MDGPFPQPNEAIVTFFDEDGYEFTVTVHSARDEADARDRAHADARQRIVDGQWRPHGTLVIGGLQVNKTTGQKPASQGRYATAAAWWSTARYARRRACFANAPTTWNSRGDISAPRQRTLWEQGSEQSDDLDRDRHRPPQRHAHGRLSGQLRKPAASRSGRPQARRIAQRRRGERRGPVAARDRRRPANDRAQARLA
jgi:hypothetical protein